MSVAMSASFMLGHQKLGPIEDFKGRRGSFGSSFFFFSCVYMKHHFLFVLLHIIKYMYSFDLKTYVCRVQGHSVSAESEHTVDMVKK